MRGVKHVETVAGRRPSGSFVSLALSLFIGVVLRVLAVELAKQIWWLLALLAIGVMVTVVLRWMIRQKKRWDGDR